MTRLNLLTSIAVAALTLNTGIALGATKTWNGSVSGAWNVAANWTPSGVPVADDDIVVQDVTNQPTFDGTGGVANSFESLTVEASAQITVSGATFIINDPTGGTVAVGTGGLIQLSGTSPVFRAAADVDLTGNGAFQMGASSTVQIDANADLTNALGGGIFGHGTINGVAGGFGQTNGKLINNSFVEASGGSTAVLMLTSTLLVEDTNPMFSGSEWIAADSATLSFFASLSNLNGDFELPTSGSGIFRFHDEVDVVTAGSFICDGDGVRIDTNASFTFDFDGMTGTTISSDCNCGTCAESP